MKLLLATRHLKASTRAQEIAEQGLELQPDNDRAEAMHHLYEVFDAEAGALIAKLEAIE